MSKIQRALCLILVLVMCLGVFAGCQKPNESKDPKDTDETVNGDATDDDTEDTIDDKTETVDPKVRDDLKETYSFGDGVQEFVILSRASTTYELKAPDGVQLGGVEQAIFDRNAEVSERCNIEINVTPQAGEWVDKDTFLQTVRSNRLLPTSQFDLITTHQAYLVSASTEGAGWDFTDLPNIEVTKAWWSEVYYDECNYNGAIYMMYGDIAYTLYEYLEVMFFNEQMAESLSIGDLYDLAIDGGWTFAKLKEYTQMIETSLDAAEEDREYGLLINTHSIRAFGTSFNCDLTTKKDDGTREFSKSLGAAVSERMQGLTDFLGLTNQVYRAAGDYMGEDEHNPVFSEGRALFYAQMLGEASYFTENMTMDYGVLPFPKYDENQKDYRTEVSDEVSAVLAPFNCKNAEMTGTVTEMMSMISYFDVITVYYGEKLQYQYFNNPMCVQSLNIIRSSFAPSFTMVYSFPLDYINSMLPGAVGSTVSAGASVAIDGIYSTKAGTSRKLLRDIYIALDKIPAKQEQARG